MMASWGAAVLVCGLAVRAAFAAAESPRTVELDYARTHGVVIVQVAADSIGRVRAIVPAVSAVSGARTDSVVAALRVAWAAARTSPWRRGGKSSLAVALERPQRTADAVLPADVRAVFRRDPLAAWIRAHSECRPGITLDDLLSSRDYMMPQLKTSIVIDLASEREQRRARLGVLIPSPSGRWVLDRMVGIEFDQRGGMGADADTGWQLLEKSTGRLVLHWVTTTESINFAAWVDDHRFVLAGNAPLDAEEAQLDYPLLRVPVVWLVDVTATTMRSFVGPPLGPDCERTAWEQIDAATRRLYPRIHSGAE